jgi:small-conductance mechanosensitive channel
MQEFTQFIDLKQLMTTGVEFVPKLFAGAAIFAAFLILYRVTRPALDGLLERAGFHKALIQLLVHNIYRYALLIVGLVMALDQFGVNVGAALAGLGIAGIALGFAAQDSVANVISGIMIFWDKPFEVDDWVHVEGQYGKVSSITLRTTRIRTPRNTFVVIPNKSVIDSVLENYSKHGELRLDVPVGIAYKEDIRRAREVLLEAISKLDHVRAQPAPDVVVDALGDSSVNLFVRVWIDDADLRNAMLCEVVEVSKLALDEAGIEIPFPHLQLFVDDVKDRVWKQAAAVAGRGAA